MPDGLMEQFLRSSHFSGGNAAYIEELYETYLHEPNSVPEEWSSFFDSLPRTNGSVTPDISHATIIQHFELLGRRQARPTPAPGSGGIHLEHERKQVKVVQLISSYRFRGHQKANLDPLGIMQREDVPDLHLHFHGLTQADLDTTFQTSPLYMGKPEATLREIVETLEETYCGHLGPEFMHITSFAEKQWLAQRFESVRSKPTYGDEARIDVLSRLTAAEGLEKHLDSKYPGTKRFGLEGGESLIPLLDCLVRRSGEYGCKEIVMAMAHRGRLNVLVNILGKNPAEMFEEFEGKRLVNTSGDVKYHQGFSSNVMTPGGEVHMALGFNPSHLEISCPVVIGSGRARQDRRDDPTGQKVVPILMHGDAAFAGQGVVMETFQLSQTRAYKTGGTIHIVINNQVGFTTSRQDDARSTEYCTDIAKMVGAPILHVNGDNPDAVMFAAMLAMDYRYEFGKDVVIDLVCYRRRGHNETDEPSSTQPLMYETIRKHSTTRTLYAQKLVAEGVVEQDQANNMANEYRASLDNGDFVVHNLVREPDTGLFVNWEPYLDHDWRTPANTGIDLKVLQDVAARITNIPDGIQVQRQVAKIYDDRRKMAGGALPLNWGMAELLAYGTLLDEGYPIRITGQDVRRGTFSHRHAVVLNQKDGEAYLPMANLADDQPRFDIYDSVLSEEAVLAFEYGYATTAPAGLIIWEAQFGDFANGAQVVIDQFIASGEHKWGRLSGLTMMLPHGFEGQGPEHSSARLERFLQLCAEHNMQVVIPTSPAQIFHLLRRQAIRPMRRPLVIMSPKWILRHKLATSSLEELANGEFQNVIGDSIDPAKARRVVLCSGKVYYHLLEERVERGIDDIALIRLEQLYPFPDAELEEILRPYSNIEDIIWCQEEPMNQGAWYSSQHHMRHVIQRLMPQLHLSYVGRESSAAPASGYMSVHLEEQKQFIDQALTLDS
ncbi:MAG: 2-oxoglutarate dehydrogenase E1 component [Porticoccaceae bacterium]|jgi:2-oxoglutarate dehydrogenase E1 component|nr:2-oxoglutarate dehydrogenase E1 component [Porticoccaceae bacterium]MDB2534080.1 2-oxoglutarate dehydrogenase E1 component [Porticoccaceae bacterium]